MGVESMPATSETVSLYVTDLLSRGLKISTAQRYAAAVSAQHRRQQLTSPLTPEVRRLLVGAKRIRPDRIDQVMPITLDQVERISVALAAEDTPLASRDRAILLVGFASALRSASLASLLLGDVEISQRGILLTIRREKQDQEGRGRYIGIPRGTTPATCPVIALEDWLKRRGGFPGPLFVRFDHIQRWLTRHLEPERICQIVQGCVRRIGLDWKLYGGHSLRAGFVTEAGEQGVSEMMIASQTGHRDMTTLRRYFRRSDVWKSNAAGAIGL
jgi:integrase